MEHVDKEAKGETEAVVVVVASVEQRRWVDRRARREMKERMRALGSGIFFPQ